MNGRRLHLEYAKSKGHDAQSFVKRETDWDGEVLEYRDSNGALKTFRYSGQDMVHWIIRHCKVELK